MSLLLDALNRASKEKQKAAAAAAHAGAAANAPPVAQVTTPPEAPAVSEQPVFSLSSASTDSLKWAELPQPTPAEAHPTPSDPVDTPRATPPVLTASVQGGAELELTLVESPPLAPPTAPVPESMARFAPPASQELPASPAMPSLEPVSPPAPEPVSASTPREPTLQAPQAPVVAVAPPAPPPSLAPAQTPPPAPAPSASVPTPQAPLRQPPTLAAKPLPEGQMAQDIRRAYDGPASDARKGRRRVMALGGLALGLALAFGSVFLGLWGDPAKWLGGSQLSTVAPLPVASEEMGAPASPAQATEPAASAAVAVSDAPAAVAISASSAPAPVVAAQGVPAAPALTAKTAGGVKVASHGKAAPAAISAAPVVGALADKSTIAAVPARPHLSFEAKTRGPSAMEQGYAHLLEGRLDDAAAAYNQALHANADERDALLGMAYISQQKGQRDDAQSYYRRVLRQEPHNARALAALQALDSGSDPTLTASRTGDLAATQPDSAVAMAMAGNAFVRDGSLSNAAQAFARAQALEPANPLHTYNLAVALDRLGRYAQAAVQYERVLALSASAPVAVRAYQIEEVRLRLTQLRQALAASTETAAP